MRKISVLLIMLTCGFHAFAQELGLAVESTSVAQLESGSWKLSDPSEELIAWSSERVEALLKPRPGQEPSLQSHSIKELPQGGWAWDSRWEMGTQQLVLRQTLVTKDDFLLLLEVGQWEACLGQVGDEPSFSDDGKGCETGLLMLQAKLH